jgi:multiple sugar transport system substrate-binding protein
VKHRSVIATLIAIPLLVTACSDSKSDKPADAVPKASVAPSASAEDQTPVTLKFWHGFTDREQKVLEGVVADFSKKYPWITVKPTGGLGDDKIDQAIRSGNVPDVAVSFSTDNVGRFCSSKGFQDLKPFIERDKIDLGQLSAAVRSYTEYKGIRCAMPLLHDAYGLYYNKTLLKEAGLTDPPKTFTELTDMAKKLTKFNPDGSIKVAGFVPSTDFYENGSVHYGPLWGARWQDDQGKSSLATDPGWKKMMLWQKDLIDFYGVDKLKRFTAKAGDEWSAENAFQTGKVAMNMDGEWRTAFIKNDAPKLDYGTAPMPVDPDQPELYGCGYVTGTIVGLPKGVKKANVEAAWKLISWLTLDTDALVKLSNGLRNVPSTTGSMSSAGLDPDPNFKTFIDIAGHPKTGTHPVTASGAAYQDLFGTVETKWQAGNISDLDKALKDADKQIDALNAQVGDGTAP